MDKNELIQVARECEIPNSVIYADEIEKFAKRIRAGDKQRIAELEKDVDILQTNLDAALKRAADFEAANFNNNQFERSSIPLEKFFRDALKGAE